jgi:hypothetical protein
MKRIVTGNTVMLSSIAARALCLSREDAQRLQPTVVESENRDDVLSCTGKLFGDDIIGVWLDLPHLSEARTVKEPAVRSLRAYENLDVCPEVSNVAALIEGNKPYGRSRPNWMANRIALLARTLRH